jgi:hypothetical protein
MAVVKCKECKEEVSSSAKTCPHCGVANPGVTGKQQALGCLVASLLLVGLFVGLVLWVRSCLSTSQSTKSPKAPHDTVAAYSICQQFVEERLKAPGSAKWPWIHTDQVTEHLGNGKYRIKSYVDSQNVFGAMVRTHFVCVVQHVDGAKWRLESLEFQGQ